MGIGIIGMMRLDGGYASGMKRMGTARGFCGKATGWRGKYGARRVRVQSRSGCFRGGFMCSIRGVLSHY